VAVAEEVAGGAGAASDAEGVDMVVLVVVTLGAVVEVGAPMVVAVGALVPPPPQPADTRAASRASAPNIVRFIRDLPQVPLPVHG